MLIGRSVQTTVQQFVYAHRYRFYEVESREETTKDSCNDTQITQNVDGG